MCVPWELNPQPFALLKQCSTTEPQEHKLLLVTSNKWKSIFYNCDFISHSLVILFFTLRQKQPFILCRHILNRKSVFRRLVSVACVFSLNLLSNSRSSTLLGTNMKPHQDSPVTRFITILQSVHYIYVIKLQTKEEGKYVLWLHSTVILLFCHSLYFTGVWSSCSL